MIEELETTAQLSDIVTKYILMIVGLLLLGTYKEIPSQLIEFYIVLPIGLLSTIIIR